MKWLGIMLTVALLTGVPGYGIAAQPGQQGTSPAAQPKGVEAKGEQGQAGKSYTLKEKKQYEERITLDLAEIQKKIEDLRGKGRQVGPQKKRTFRMALVDVQRKNIAAQNRLAALKKAPEKDWSGMKADMDKAIEELSKACLEAEKLL